MPLHIYITAARTHGHVHSLLRAARDVHAGAEVSLGRDRLRLHLGARRVGVPATAAARALLLTEWYARGAVDDVAGCRVGRARLVARGK